MRQQLRNITRPLRRQTSQNVHQILSSTLQIKRALSGPFVLKPRSLCQPGLNGRGAVLCFPFFQGLVVAAFGFDDFTGVRIFVDFHLAWLSAAGFGFDDWSATAGLWIK